MTARRTPSLRRQALALEPRFLLDAAVAATAAQVVDATDTKPGASAEGAAAHVTIDDNSTTHSVDLFDAVAVSTDNHNQDLDTLVITVDRSGANQALVIDGTEVKLTASSGQTGNNNFLYKVEVGGDGSSTITITLASSDTANTPAGAKALIDGLEFKTLDNTVESGTVTVTLKSLSDTGGDVTDLDIHATVDITSSINVPPVLSDAGSLDGRENLSLGDLGSATEVAYSGDGKYAYVAGKDGIQVYAIDGGGALTAVQTFSHEDLNTVSHMVISADGKSIYTTSSDNDSYVVHMEIGADGKLSYVSSVTSSNGVINGGMAISDDGQYLYVGTQYNGVVIYQRDASTGDLAIIGRAGDNSRSGMIATAGDYVYVISLGMPHELTVYQRDTNGLLNQIDNQALSAVGNGYSPVDYSLVTSADGSTLYIGNPGKGSIQVYQVQDGVLTAVTTETPGNVRSIALSPDGKTLYATQSDGKINVYAIAANGTLALTGTLSSQGNGSDIAVSTDGLSVLVAGGNVQRYSSVHTLPVGSELNFADGLTLSDSNNDVLNGGAGDYQGSTITVKASTDSGSFGFTAGNDLSLSGNSILHNGVAIATFTGAGDTLTITFTAATSKAVANQVLHQISYANDSATRDSAITLSITGGDGALDSQTVVITLMANHAPQVDSRVTVDVDPGQTETDYSLTLPQDLFKDSDGDSLTWTLSGLPAGLSFDAATRTISGSTTAAGSYTLTITASDIHGGSASTTLELVIDQIDNRAPVVNHDVATTLDSATADQSYSIKLDPALFSDPDSRYGDSLTWTIDGLPAGLVFDAATLTLTGTASALGNYTLTITATDKSGASVSQEVTLRVISQAEAANSAPVLGADADKVVYDNDGTLSGYGYYVNSITTSADGSLVIIAGSTGTSAVGGVSAQGDNFLSVYQRDSKTGELTLLQTFRQGTDDGDASNGIEVDGLSAITAVTLSKDGKYVYVAGYGASGSDANYGISMFAVNADGTLERLGSVDNVGQKIVDVAMSSDGDQLIVLSTTTIYSYTVGDDGQLTLKQSLVPLYSGGFNAAARDLDIDANGTVYAISNGRMAIYTYDSSSDTLTYRGTLQNNGGIKFHQYDESGNFVVSQQVASTGAFSASYSMAAAGDGNVYITTFSNFSVLALKYDASTNSMSFVQSVETTSPLRYPVSLETSADGSTLYVGYGFDSSINAYRIGEDGSLTLVQSISTGLNRVYRILAGENGDIYVGNFLSGGSTGLGLISATDTVRGSYLEGSTSSPTAGLTLSDSQFDALDNGAGNYKDAGITLVRDGGANAEDSFGFAEGNGLTLKDGQIYLNGTAIASFSNDGNALSIVFIADTSSATATAVLRQITYSNSNKTLDGNIALKLSVKDEYVATELTLRLAVTAVNDAPEVSASPVSGELSVGDPAVDLFKDVDISTVESGQSITSITLTVDGLHDGASEALRIDGENIALVAGNGTTAGGYGYVITLDGDKATVTLTHGSGMSTADATTLITGLAYANSDSQATVGERHISLTAMQDSGGTEHGGKDTATLDITATIKVLDESPRLGSETGSLTYEELVKAIADDGWSNLFEGVQDAVASGKYVYVVRTASVWDSSTISEVEVSSIYVLEKGADGKLSLVQTLDSKSVSALGGAADVRVSEDGNTVYVIGNKGVAVFASTDGVLSAAGAIGADLIDEHGLIRDVQAGKDGAIYVTAGSSLLVYAPDAEGTLSLLQTLEDAGDTGMQLDGANAMTMSADGSLLFVATSGGNTLVSVFRIGADGKLSYVAAAQGPDASADQAYYTNALTLSPDGKQLYAVDYDGSDYRLYTLTVAADGTLGNASVIELADPASSLVVSPDGAMLFVVGQEQITLYTRDASGVITLAGTLDNLGGLSIGELRGATLSADGTELYLSGTLDWDDGLIVVKLSAASSTYTEGGDAVALVPGATISDPQLDAKNNGAGDYQGASIEIEREGGANSLDQFGFQAGDGYTIDTAAGTIALNGVTVASFAQSGGKLTVAFTASISKADAQQVLRRISYVNSSADPTRDSDKASFTITLNDGDGHSGKLAAEVALIGVNDPPVIDTTPLTPTYPAEGEPVKLFEGTTIDTVEAGQNIWQVIVTVTPANASDILGVDGGRIALDKATSGTSTTGTGLTYMVSIANGVTTVTLYLNSSPERAAEVIDSLSYSHSGDASSGSVSIGVNVREYADENTLSDFSGKAVVELSAANGPNTAPTLGGGSDVGYTELADPVAIAPGATVADAQMDSFNQGLGNYNGSTLTISLGAGSSAADSLAFLDGNGLTRSGDQILKDGKLIGRITQTADTLTISFTDEAGAIPTTADVQNALHQITYANSSHVPAERVAVSVTLADQRGLQSAALNFNIDITAVNDLPVVETDPVLSLGELSQLQHLADLAGLSTLTASTASADGSSVYVADNDGGIALLTRDSSTGEYSLTRVFSGSDGLNGVKQLTLSEDGKTLYAMRKDGNSIAWLNVAEDGTLSYGGAISSVYEVDGGKLYDMRDFSLSSDGKTLYLTNAYQVVILTRDSSTGALSYSDALEGNMWGEPYLWAPTDIVTQDNLVYVVTNASTGSTLIVYQRDDNGSLSLLGYAKDGDAAGASLSLSGLQHIEVSADGKTIYVASGSQIDAFSLNTSTGALTHLGVFASDLAIQDIALTADGKALYATLADGSLNYYATANGALVATQSGMAGASQLVLLPGGGILVLGDAVDVLSAPPVAAPAATLGGEPVVLAPVVKISDAELDAAGGGAGNYQGASLVFTGQAGDSFTLIAADGYTLAADGKTVLLNGSAVALLEQSNGVATLSFTAAVTTAQANAIVHRIGYTAGGDSTGTRSISVRMNDGSDNSSVYQIDVSVLAPNLPPEIGDADYTPAAAEQGKPYQVVLPESLFKDPEGDALSWTVSGLPQGLSFDADTRTISGTTSVALDSYDIVVTVTDSAGNSASRTLTLEVTETPNSAPVDSGIELTPGQPQAGSDYSYTLPQALFTDADGDALTWTVEGLPEGLSFDPVTRVISGTPLEAGQYELVISARDPSGATVSRSLTLTVSVATPNPGGEEPEQRDAPPPLPQTYQPSFDHASRTDAAQEQSLQAVFARPANASGLFTETPSATITPASAVLLDGLLADSFDRDERWARGLGAMRTADGKTTPLLALASPEGATLAGPDKAVSGVWHYDRDNNRQVFTLPAGLVRSSSAVASIGLRMSDGSELPAGVRLDTVRGQIIAPGLNGARSLSLQLLVRTVDGRHLSVPIVISAERQGHGLSAPSRDDSQADSSDAAAANKLALSLQLRQSATQDILAQAQQLLAALGDDPAPAARQASTITVES